MTNTMQKVRASFILAVTLIALTATAWAGQPRASSPIPGRVTKVKEGDWVLIRTGDELIKETAVKITDMKSDARPGDEAYFDPIFMVEYKMERFNGATGQPNGAPMEVVRALEHEIEENAEFARSIQGKVQRRKVKIDGKNVNVVVIPQAEDGGILVEHWFTDEFGIDGKAGMVVKMPENETYTPMEVVAFGNARQALAIQKYLKK